MLNIAKTSKTLANFIAKICVIIMITPTNTANISKENIPNEDTIIKNQNDKPADTASPLNLGDDNSNLNYIEYPNIKINEYEINIGDFRELI